MIKKRFLSMLALLAAVATGAVAQDFGEIPMNSLIYSVDFSEYDSYPFYLDGQQDPETATAFATVEDNLLVLTNTEQHTEKYEVQPEIGRPTSITKGKCYEVEIEYKSTVAGPVNVVLGSQDWANMDGAWWVPITVSDDFQTLKATFLKCSYGATDNHILFQFGDLLGTVYIKSVKVYEFDYIGVTSVTLPSSTAELTKGDKIALTADIAPIGTIDKTVKWSVGGTNADAVKLYTDEACTTEVGSDATSALTVYALGLSEGEATVTVTSNDDAEKKATCTVNVTVPPTYSVAMKEGTEDATNWQGKAGEGEYQALPLEGVAAGTAVSVKYNGTKKVKSVKAVKKAAAPAEETYKIEGVNNNNAFNVAEAATLPFTKKVKELFADLAAYAEQISIDNITVSGNVEMGTLAGWDTEITFTGEGTGQITLSFNYSGLPGQPITISITVTKN